MITLTNITIENDKVTLTLEDFLKLIKKDKLTEVEYKVEPKPMAFDTKKELTIMSKTTQMQLEKEFQRKNC